MTFKIVVLSLVLGIWGLDARSQNEEPDFSGQSEDSLMQALGNIPAFTIYKDNYVVTGTSFTGGKISKYNSDAKFQISLRQPQKKGYPTISNLSAEKNVFQVLQTT